MRVKNITLNIQDKKHALNTFAETLSKTRKGEQVPKTETISVQNIETVRKILTEKRLELLHIIKQKNPESIYELAKEAKRDLKSVNTDIQILTNSGLVSLEELYKERKKMKPILEFDKLQVEIAV